ESGATCLRAGRAAEAERFLDDGLTRFGSDSRTRMFGEQALWLYKRGAARAALGKNGAAEQDLRQAVSLEGRSWVLGRAHIELGRLALGAGNRTKGRAEIQTGIALCESDNDTAAVEDARRLLK